MSIHRETVLGFLAKWALTASEEEVGLAVGVLLGRIAERGTPSRLEVGGQALTFSKDAMDQMHEAVRTMLGPQSPTGRA